MNAKILYKENVPIGIKISNENEEEAFVLGLMDIQKGTSFKIAKIELAYTSLGTGEIYLIKNL